MNIQPDEIIPGLVPESDHTMNTQPDEIVLESGDMTNTQRDEGVLESVPESGYTMKIQPDEIVPRLISEFGYPEKHAVRVAHSLQECTPTVQEAFEKWWRGEGLDASLEVKGYTLKLLIEEYGFGPIAAFLDMDWLIREPEKAAQALSEGYDTIE